MPTLRSSVILLAVLMSSLIRTTTTQQQGSTPKHPISKNSTGDCSLNNQFGPDGNTYNASAAYQVPGFYPPGTSGAGTVPTNWTYNTAVTVSNGGGGYSQTVWIDTPNVVNLTSKNLPYYGCVSVFLGLPHSTVQRGQNDNGDCMQTFDEGCVSAVIGNAKQQASRFDETTDEASDLCARLIQSVMPGRCNRYKGNDNWGGASSGKSILSIRLLIELPTKLLLASIGNTTYSNGTDGHGCPVEIQGANKGLFSWGVRPEGDSDTAYERAVTSVTPVLTTVWSKDNSTINPAWTDARFICMRPSQIRAGSREPDGVPSLGMTTDARSIVSRLVLAVAFGIVWMI
ncbi:MAG: hypothetical protein Q9213_006363 [Squamulea squamosa]